MCENSEDLDKICSTLDKLTLEALMLMEQHVELKLNVENAMIGGEENLAKARYIMGQNTVSRLQLPSEHGPEVSASILVTAEDDKHSSGAKSYELKSEENGDDTAHNPIKWFGILTPQSLNLAQNMYRQALQWAIQAATVQSRLWNTLGSIGQLKQLKKQIVEPNGS